jgi:hypothetical protein
MTHALRNNRRGGIEGLPMELLIIIVVATIGVGILIGWMNDLQGQEPETYGDISSDVTMVSVKDSMYTVNGDSTCADTSFDMTVHVVNGKGDGIENAVVKLTGLGVTGSATYGQTGSNGDITFKGLTVKTVPAEIGYITANISSDIGDTELKIPVVKG